MIFWSYFFFCKYFENWDFDLNFFGEYSDLISFEENKKLKGYATSFDISTFSIFKKLIYSKSRFDHLCQFPENLLLSKYNFQRKEFRVIFIFFHLVEKYFIKLFFKKVVNKIL